MTRKRWTWLVGAAALMALASLFAACGGDDDDADSGGSKDTKSDATSASGEKKDDEKTSSGDKTAEATKDDAKKDSGGGTSDKVAKDIEDLVKKAEKKTYLLTYEVTSKEGTLNWTLAQKDGKTLLRFEEDGELTTIINDGKNSYTCSKPKDEKGTCLKIPNVTTNDDPLLFDAEGLAEEIRSSSTTKEIAGRKIAGRDARCFESIVDGEKGEVCLDKNDGFWLYSKDNDGTFTAKEVKTSVDDKTFEPPYDVTELGG